MTNANGFARTVRQRATLLFCLLAALCLCAIAVRPAHADTTLNPALLPRIQAATFEVVAAKPADTLSYEKPLPLDLLPYQERTDKYYSVGTAFAIGPNTFVTAAHVLMIGYDSLWGPPELRDASGKVYAIDKIEKFAFRRDFVVFSLKDPPKFTPLAVDPHPALNQVVYSVGNALGTGVVIRNGLYTSNTPEDQDGAWKWIRFSAAASPGNSGGPLLDQNGSVIGVVLMKSPNENLNYALPIGMVADAPANLARYDKRITYSFDVFDSTYTSLFKGQFALPKTVPGFFGAFRSAFEPFLQGQLKDLLAQQSANLFPNGAGSHQILYGGPSMTDFPQLLERNSDGVWGLAGKSRIRITLPANGYIEGGTAGHDILFHVRKPDNVSGQAFHHDPKGLMDGLLRTGMLKRSVGGEAVRVTSLGAPVTTGACTDRWGRHWQVWTWPIPYANAFQVLYALPTPDGYVVMTRMARAMGAYDSNLDMRALTDFISTPYDGTLAQWQDFLADGTLLPTAFKDIRIAFEYGKDFTYRSPNVDLAATTAIQAIAPDSMLTLGFGFYPAAGGKVTWNVAQVWLAQSAHDHHWLSVTRNQAPTSDLDDSFQSYWKKLVERRHPYDGQAYSENDVTKINAVVPPAAGDAASVLYTAYVFQPGTQPQAEMQQKLDLLLHGIRVR